MFEFDAKLSTAVETDHRPSHPPKPTSKPLSPELLQRMQRYWQAANYLTIGQIYLRENPLLREPLKPEHIKPRLLGHWGTSPGQNFIYVHLNRLIKEKARQHHLYLRAGTRRARRWWRRVISKGRIRRFILK